MGWTIQLVTLGCWNLGQRKVGLWTPQPKEVQPVVIRPQDDGLVELLSDEESAGVEWPLDISKVAQVLDNWGTANVPEGWPDVEMVPDTDVKEKLAQVLPQTNSTQPSTSECRLHPPQLSNCFETLLLSID